jgi:hypothetical protein
VGFGIPTSGKGMTVVTLTDRQKDEAVKLAQEISKYAFALSFYSSYPKSGAERLHCQSNLERSVKELVNLIRL